jgi:hypothetical protein
MIFLLASLPTVLVMLAAIAVTGFTLGLDISAVRASGPFKAFGILAYALAIAFAPAVYVAVASRLYQWMADAVKTPQSRI